MGPSEPEAQWATHWFSALVANALSARGKTIAATAINKPQNNNEIDLTTFRSCEKSRGIIDCLL
jgi:hypothetical protein